MDWKSENVVATGSRDFSIKFFDLRFHKEISVREKHMDELCGLKWDHNKMFLASGGNDNIINIWDIRKQNPL
jgi:cell division cycle protein 20 (cofactor of APC complex)